MKKTLPALAACFGLMSSASNAADGFVQIGDGSPAHHPNITIEECRALGEKAAQFTSGLTPVRVVCAPSQADKQKDPNAEQFAYTCYRTKGPTLCQDR